VTVRLAVSTEGATEREFVSHVLKPHLEALGLFVKPIALTGAPAFTTVRTDLRLLVRGFSHVTTLYDFYEFQGRPDTPAALEAAIHDLVGGNANVIPYVQVHEFEALVFAGPDEAAQVLGQPSLAGQLSKIVRQCGQPEAINSNYDNCPSRRLKRLFPPYDKVRHGYKIIERIGLDKVRQACPRFGRWLSQLEGLAG
jgi:hypothetical protein